MLARQSTWNLQGLVVVSVGNSDTVDQLVAIVLKYQPCCSTVTVT